MVDAQPDNDRPSRDRRGLRRWRRRGRGRRRTPPGRPTPARARSAAGIRARRRGRGSRRGCGSRSGPAGSGSAARRACAGTSDRPRCSAGRADGRRRRVRRPALEASPIGDERDAARRTRRPRDRVLARLHRARSRSGAPSRSARGRPRPRERARASRSSGPYRMRASITADRPVIARRILAGGARPSGRGPAAAPGPIGVDRNRASIEDEHIVGEYVQKPGLGAAAGQLGAGQGAGVVLARSARARCAGRTRTVRGRREGVDGAAATGCGPPLARFRSRGRAVRPRRGASGRTLWPRRQSMRRRLLRPSSQPSATTQPGSTQDDVPVRLCGSPAVAESEDDDRHLGCCVGLDAFERRGSAAHRRSPP